MSNSKLQKNNATENHSNQYTTTTQIAITTPVKKPLKRSFEIFNQSTNIDEIQEAPVKKKLKRSLEAFNHTVNTGEIQQIPVKSISNLKKIRLNRGFTLEHLARLTNISASYLSRIESQHRRLNTEVIKRLCIVLNCYPSELLDDFHNDQQSLNISTFTKAVPDLLFCQMRCVNDKLFLDTESNTEWIYRPHGLESQQSAFATTIVTSENTPKYRMNDIIYLKPISTLKYKMPALLVLEGNQIVIGEIIAVTAVTVNICSFNGKVTSIHKINNLTGRYLIYMSMERYSC